MPGGVEGGVMFEEYLLDGTWFTAMDAGPEHDFRFNEAVSFIIECEDQAELDHYWTALSSVPESEQCGWCKDKYGLSWQIIPKRLVELMTAGGSEKSNKVMRAFMKMKKLNVAELEAAYNS